MRNWYNKFLLWFGLIPAWECGRIVANQKSDYERRLERVHRGYVEVLSEHTYTIERLQGQLDKMSATSLHHCRLCEKRTPCFNCRDKLVKRHLCVVCGGQLIEAVNTPQGPTCGECLKSSLLREVAEKTLADLWFDPVKILKEEP